MNIPQRSKATIDHVIPKSRGGALQDPSNIVPCCGMCNSKKSDKTLEELGWTFKFPYLSTAKVA